MKIPNKITKLFVLASMATMEAGANEEIVPIPKTMSNAGIMLRAKVLDVGPSTQGLTENSRSKISLSVSKLYRGAMQKGELDIEISGWLGSEKSESIKFTNAKENGQEVIVILDQVYNPFLKRTGGYAYRHLFLATDEAIRQAEDAAKLPIGWAAEENSGATFIESPWAAIDRRFVEDSMGKPVCSKSKRPAFLADSRLKMTVDLTKNKKIKQQLSQQGFPGIMYRVSITNPTKEPITVEALRSFGEKILWDESLLFINHDEAWLPQGFNEFTKPSKATVIAPGETVTNHVSFTAQFSQNTLVCLGNLSFSIYNNVSRNMPIYLRDEKHPAPPFQGKLKD